ncbi:hypothetical protein L195_g052131, partial [Trifolium pratense]
DVQILWCVLSIRSCPGVTDDSISRIAFGVDWKKFSNLKDWLEIRFSELSAEGLNSISQRCPNLEFLALSGCHNLTNRDIANASSNSLRFKHIEKPNSYYQKFSSFCHAESYGHLRLYDGKFQRNVFRM